MPELAFAVEDVQPIAYAAVPTLGIRLRVTSSAPVEHVALQTQLQIEPAFRSYAPEEQTLLRDLFDDPRRWGETLKTLLWTHVHAVVPPFGETAAVELPVPCSFDFNVAATKYFAGLERGEIPLRLLFSGTIFYRTAEGSLQIAQIPWDREATCRLPVEVWRRMMALYYPNTAWLCLRNDVFARLYEYKVRRGLPTWEHAMSEILDQVQGSSTRSDA